MSAPSLASFQSAPDRLRCAQGEVHLWRADLDTAVCEPGAPWKSLLSAEELERANRFRFQRNRSRFITGRGLLRSILARYLNTEISPESLPIAVGAFGKPTLLAPYTEWEFNLSHSGGLMLLALSCQRRVGVDVEHMRAGLPYAALTEQFAPADAAAVLATPEAERPGEFYRVWTNTEARLKAAGTGFAGAQIIIEPDRWSLLSLTPAPGYAAALAAEGPDPFQLHCWSWPK